MSYIIKSCAKINITLEVLYKREDKFHEINTIFYKTKIHDTLHLSKSAKYKISFDKPIDIPLEDNLIYKAAMSLQRFVEKDLSVNVYVEKQIPTGGGLGGGSSNAAATLLALNDFFDLNMSLTDLHKIAIDLGSDVPFFLRGNACIARGRGELLEEIEIRNPYHILLVNPGIHVSTPLAYKSLGKGDEIVEGTRLSDLVNGQKTLNPDLLQYFKNDFEEYVFKTFPKINEIKNTLYDSGAIFALMSGSGSTVFGMFSDISLLESAKNKFKEYYTAVSLAD